MDHRTATYTAACLAERFGEEVSRRVALRRLAGGGLGLALGTGALRVRATAQESTPGASSATTGVHRHAVGAITLRTINDGEFGVPPGFVAANAPPGALADALAEAGQNGDAFVTRSLNLLIETGGELVLVDTGFGGLQPGTGRLLPRLAGEGVAPEDVTLVLLTHLHADHVLGAVDAAGKPAFPNARYLINRAERAFWASEPGLDELVLPDEAKQQFRAGAKGVIDALGSVLEEVAPGDEIAPGVTVLEAYGHTPGHVAVEIVSNGAGLLHVVDAATDPVLSLRHPDWFGAPENWPARALATRRALLDRAAAEGLTVQTYHFPFPGLGRVAQDGDGWRWEAAG
jgi:glyoxylase-like metal-dependent hydrolase (beta-lactamase superfamily II)